MISQPNYRVTPYIWLFLSPIIVLHRIFDDFSAELYCYTMYINGSGQPYKKYSQVLSEAAHEGTKFLCIIKQAKEWHASSWPACAEGATNAPAKKCRSLQNSVYYLCSNTMCSRHKHVCQTDTHTAKGCFVKKYVGWDAPLTRVAGFYCSTEICHDKNVQHASHKQWTLDTCNDKHCSKSTKVKVCNDKHCSNNSRLNIWHMQWQAL